MPTARHWSISLIEVSRVSHQINKLDQVITASHSESSLSSSRSTTTSTNPCHVNARSQYLLYIKKTEPFNSISFLFAVPAARRPIRTWQIERRPSWRCHLDGTNIWGRYYRSSWTRARTVSPSTSMCQAVVSKYTSIERMNWMNKRRNEGDAHRGLSSSHTTVSVFNFDLFILPLRPPPSAICQYYSASF